MRLATIFIPLFILVAPSFIMGNEPSDGGQTSVCLVSMPKSVFNLPEIALEKTKLTLVEAKDGVLSAVKALPEKVDGLALSLADRLESSKTQSLINDGGQTSVIYEDEAQALGTNTDSGRSLTASAYNAGVDTLGFLLRHWLWSISGLGVLGFFFAFRP